MSIINTNAKEIHCKIVYCGPKNSGKKTTLLYIKDQFKESKISFLHLPFKPEIYALVLDIGKIFGFQTFFHIYNLNNKSLEDNRQLLIGADGLLFLASSKPEDKKLNQKHFSEIELFLKENYQNPFKFPLVLQYNKRDLNKKMSLRTMRIDLNKYNCHDFESSTIKGMQVLEPLKQLCKLVLNNLKSGRI